MEIISGQQPCIISPERIHIVKWVSLKVHTSDIKNIVDPSLQGNFDINVAWKIVEVSMSCTSENAEERITMSNVVVQLKQGLAMDESQNVLEQSGPPYLSDINTSSYAQHSPSAGKLATLDVGKCEINGSQTYTMNKSLVIDFQNNSMKLNKLSMA